ncbi:MAG TPA: 3-hydroxyacyl-CoA dehydrogenase NAD-binding domain-containing protein [Casimicrobiaceae bacterium]|jgi:3-hydroxyacyl-CoA dehydrogenase/enoyl-CoA hydratase/3-hydroxybutyryl-CoA epimerase|nr:3-hydroxyacyl-CoA dehydrogenase NAD-binding domain-containing protein [Casimicrobiaceae bacterium]
MTLRHWKLDADGDGLAWLTIDRAGASTNSLSAEVLEELRSVLSDLAAAPPKGLIIRSGKDNGFIAGADIEEFERVKTVDDAVAIVKRGWDIFDELAAARYPTLALIRGFCLGGGLELALACRYRVVVDEPGTRLGLPEVMLGIVPGWGGMRRLPRLAGAPAALDLLLTGKTIDARRAKKLGVADECVPTRIMINTARGVLLAAPSPRRLPFPLSLTLNPLLRPIIAAQARKQVSARARREHYPAPYAILDIWVKHDGDALAAPPSDPASIAHLIQTPTAMNLIRVFRLQERLKAFGRDDVSPTPNPSPVGGGEPSARLRRESSDGAQRSGSLRDSHGPAGHVHVIGAGTMGGDIAAWCALRGLTVTMQDQSPERLKPAIERAGKLFSDRLKDSRRVRDAFDRLIPDIAGDGAARADVIIEAIFENLDAKRELFVALEAKAKPSALLATNTSSIPLEQIGAPLKDPGRLIGLHFFNPVAKMMLVEVVHGSSTHSELLPRACAFARQIDKLPLPVKSAPGFLVNRILAPYLMEAMRCVDEGIAPETVDEAALAFGMPVGPIELADTVGLDICLAVGKMLGKGAEPPKKLTELNAAGHLGKKSKRGFYDWSSGKAAKSQAGAVPQGLADRLIRPYIAEAKTALAEGIVADADLVDAGAIFGTGFAPFRGGPLHYAAGSASPSASIG